MNYMEQLKMLRTWDKDVVVEGEIAGRTVFLMHIHQSNAESCIQQLKEDGGRVVDVTKPQDKCRQVDGENDEWGNHWVFRVYFPPVGADHVFITSEIMEKAATYFQRLLKLDRLAISRLLFSNCPCEHELVDPSHDLVRRNAIFGADGKPAAAVSAWGLINGMLQAITGERLGFVTMEDEHDLNGIASGKNPLKAIVREIK